MKLKIIWFNTPYLSEFSPNTGKYGPEITPYLDIFYAVQLHYLGIVSLKVAKQLLIQSTFSLWLLMISTTWSINFQMFFLFYMTLSSV